MWRLVQLIPHKTQSPLSWTHMDVGLRGCAVGRYRNPALCQSSNFTSIINKKGFTASSKVPTLSMNGFKSLRFYNYNKLIMNLPTCHKNTIIYRLDIEKALTLRHVGQQFVYPLTKVSASPPVCFYSGRSCKCTENTARRRQDPVHLRVEQRPSPKSELNKAALWVSSVSSRHWTQSSLVCVSVKVSRVNGTTWESARCTMSGTSSRCHVLSSK